MKSYLKIFVVIGALTMSVALLSACADKPSTPPPPAPEPVRPNS